MQEAVAATTEHVNTTYNYTGESAVRCGFRHGGQFVATWPDGQATSSMSGKGVAPWKLLAIKDGYPSPASPLQHPAGVGRPAGLDGPGLRHGRRPDGRKGQYNDHFILRGEHSGHIEDLIQQWALLHTRQEITEFGQSNHHPWGPAATPDEILRNEQLWSRGYLTTVESPDGSPPMVYPGDPYRLTDSPRQPRRTAPAPGEHNAEVLSGILGLSPEDLKRLSARGGL